MKKNSIYFMFVAFMALLSPILSFGFSESGSHAKTREFACGNDPFQQCMDALIKLCGNPARMSCARKYQSRLSTISREAAK